MPNYNQAPILHANGQKERPGGNGRSIRPHALEDAIMAGLGDRDMGALKLILFLTGQSTNGNFALPEKTILERCNMSIATYKRARSRLIELGWITHVPSQAIYINYDTIYDGQGSHNDTPSPEVKEESAAAPPSSALDAKTAEEFFANW